MILSFNEDSQGKEQDLPRLFPVKQHPISDQIETAALRIPCRQKSGMLTSAVNEREKAVHQGIDRVPFQDQILHEPRRYDSQGHQKEQPSQPQRLELPAGIPCVEIADRTIQEGPRDKGIVFCACRDPHENRRHHEPFDFLVTSVSPAKKCKH